MILYSIHIPSHYGMCMALCRRQPADRPRCVRIGLLCQNVAAEVIREHPGCAGVACRQIRLGIHPDQLPKVVRTHGWSALLIATVHIVR